MPYEQHTAPGNAPNQTFAAPSPEDRSLESQTLLGKTGQVWINHRGRMYQLRETRNGKLILTS